jgi:hypothetical protein
VERAGGGSVALTFSASWRREWLSTRLKTPKLVEAVASDAISV